MTIQDVLVALFVAYGTGFGFGLLLGGIASQFNDIFR